MAIHEFGLIVKLIIYAYFLFVCYSSKLRKKTVKSQILAKFNFVICMLHVYKWDGQLPCLKSQFHSWEC